MPPPASGPEKLIYSLCDSIKFWYQAIGDWLEADEGGEKNISQASAMLRCSLRAVERAASLPVNQSIPFSFSAAEVAHVLLDQALLVFNFENEWMAPQLAAVLLDFESSTEDDLALLADLANEAESEDLVGFGTILSH